MIVTDFQEHLVEGATTSDHKVGFIVPTANLVTQQERMFKEFLPSEYRTLGISGQTDSRVPLVKQLHDSSVIVFTAQIFLNASDEDIKQLFRLLTLVFFDECHHTDKASDTLLTRVPTLPIFLITSVFLLASDNLLYLKFL